MATIIGFLFIAGFIWWIANAASNNLLTSVSAIDKLARTGVRARGLVLVSSQVAVGVTFTGRRAVFFADGGRFERRTMTIDVEIPGRAPYITTGAFLVPRGLVEAIPGSSLELAVDPAKPGRIVVLGPGGFTGPWLRVGPPNAY